MEQHAWWTPRRGPAPGYGAQARQLTEARAANPWLAAGSVTVQQQALRDFAQAMANFFAGTHRRPTWRKAGVHEGFRIVGVRGQAWEVRRLSRRTGEVRVPKVGWVRLRWSRPVPAGVRSFRVTRDRAGRWHVAFAAIPAPVPAPGNSAAVGVDRGVVVSAALSTGETSAVPGLTRGEAGHPPRPIPARPRTAGGVRQSGAADGLPDPPSAASPQGGGAVRLDLRPCPVARQVALTEPSVRGWRPRPPRGAGCRPG
ncbi:hypothetical protein [Actinomadura latina]|uniref:hypothetical protein n=1 Tax=Actinomadura latina TaxID=163603 RepID=UPI000B24FB30|nr:hypothetical protein [Actinomadura latina]